MYRDRKTLMYILLSFFFLFCKYKDPLVLYSCLILLCILNFLLLISNRQKIYKSYFFLAILFSLFWVIILLYIGLSLEKYEQNHWRYSIISIFYLVVVVNTSILIPNFYSIKFKNTISNCYYITSFVLIGLFLLYLFNIYIPRREDFSGFYEDRNTFSVNLILLTLLFYSVNYKKCKIYKFRYHDVLTFCNIIIILFTKSLTGIFLVFATLFFIFRKNTFILFVSVVLIICVIVAQFYVLDKNPITRANRFLLNVTDNTEELNESESAYVRPFYIIKGITLFINNNYQAFGLDNIRYYFARPGTNIGTYLHNNYLDILTGLGFIGFFAYYLPIIFALFLFNGETIDIKFLRLILISKLFYDITYSNYMDIFPLLITVIAIKLLYDQKNSTYIKN